MMVDADMGMEAPETRPIPALPGHPGSLVLPDFHMDTKALPHWSPGHRRGFAAASQTPTTWPHSQAPCAPAAQRSIISRSRRCCGNGAATKPWGGKHRSQNSFCSKLAVPEDSQKKYIRGAMGKGNMPNKISQGEGVCLCMLKAELISSLFHRLFAGDKHLGEAELRRTPVAAHSLGGGLVMPVTTQCQAGGTAAWP